MNCESFLYILLIMSSCNIVMNKLHCRQDSCEAPVVEYVVRVDGTFSDAKAVARLHGLELIDKMIGFEGIYIMHLKQIGSKKRRRRSPRDISGPGVKWVLEQEFLTRTKRSSLPSASWNDPLYPDMWYLNRASKGEGYDMNVLEAWELGYTGKGIKITIMDDGIDYTHPDLLTTYDPKASTDINGRDNDPMPDIRSRDNKHGTRCAGQIAAQGNNSVCVVGIAYNAQIGGIRMLDGYITDRVEAETLHFRQDYIDIYSGSWGPEDSGKLYEGPGILAQSAFQQGVVTGRRGFGNIYVWASGNGGSLDDSCACDGYSSSPFTLSVSGVSESNTRPWYLEKCSSTLVSTYSSGSPMERMISTIDLGHDCTRMHSGTSASAPMAAGIIALLLEANDRLSWRDVQYITLLTANPKPFKDGNFTKNAVGREYSQLYGYGLMDAGKMVRLGELWRGVPPHHRCTSNVIDVQKNLGGKFNHTLFLNFSGCQPKTQDNESLNKLNKSTSENGTPIRYLEHVQVYADIVYQRRGLLRLSVISPSGTLSVLLPPRIHDEHSGNIAMLRWPVTTVQFWGESAIGTWQIRLDSILGTEISRVDPDNIKGFWRSVWIVAYGTDEFPIRLKPPSPSRPPPPEWFESFAEYVVDDQHWHKVYTCHSECVPGGCTGPAADQCLYGCKTFATESRQCVSVCPPGTTAFGALRLSNSLNNYANANKNNNNNNNGQKSRDRVKPEAMLSSSGARIRSSVEGYPLGVNDDPLQINGNNQQGFKNEMVCQPCWSLCSACIRPHIEYDCTACSNQRFLVPLLTANEDKGLSFSFQSYQDNNGQTNKNGDNKNNNNNVHLENAKHLNFNLPQVIGTCRTECPAGFFGNKSTSICESCAENCARCVGSKSDECRECYPGFRLIHGRCVDSTSADGRCKPGQYLKHSECVNCHPSCDKAGCVTSNQCNWCPSHLPNYFNGTCTKSCPEGWYSGVHIRPPFHSNIQDQVSSVVKQPSVQMCEPCSPGCQKCINFSLCEVCLPYLMLHNGTCKLPEDNTTNLNITPTLVNKSNSQVNSKLLGIPSNQCGSVSCSTCYGGIRKNCLSCSRDYYLLEITLFNALQNVDIFNGNSIIINNNNKNNKNNNNISSTTALSSSSLSTSSTSSSPSTTTTQLNQIHYPVNNISSVYTDTSITELTPLMSTTKSMPTDTSTTSTTRTPTSTTTLTTTDDNVVKSFSLLKRTMKNKGVLISRRFVVHTNIVNNHISNSLNLSYPKFICVHICPTGYYVKRISVGENEITMCSKCPPSCSSCTDISHCNACQTGFYLDKKSNHCLLRTVCRFSEYFDEDKGICRPCDPNCRTCSGPRSYQCTSCNRKPPVPRCLLTNQRVSKLHRTSKDLAIWPPDQLSVEPNSGQCLVCCPYRLALTSRDPRQCMFCVADKLVCLSGDEIGAGESGYILEEVNKKHQSLWELFTKEPSRLVLFIICLIIITVLLIFILVHFILSRRRYRHYYHQHCPTAAAAASVYCPCCRRHVSVPGSGGNDESEGKRSKQIVTSVTKKRKARQLAHLNNNNNSNNNRRHNRHPTNPPNGGNTEHAGGGDDDEDDYDYDVDDIRAEQISLRSKMNNKDNNISFIDKFITDRGELNNASAIATTDMTPTITTTGINTTTSSDNNNNSNNNNSYTPYYKSSICSSNGNLHSGRVHRLSTEETINSHIPPPCIIISSTPQSIATAIPLNNTNPHHHQYIRYNQLSSKDDNNGEKLISDTTTESSLSTTEAVNT